MTKYTVPEAMELARIKRARGDRMTTINITVSMNTGIIRTCGNLAIVDAMMKVLVMRDGRCTAEVETEVEYNKNL